MDERLLEIAEHADLVYSPLVDVKEYPEGVDVCLVEGAVSTTDDFEKIKKVRLPLVDQYENAVFGAKQGVRG